MAARGALAGVLAEGPGGRAALVPAALGVLGCGLAEVAPRMRALLAATFGLERPESQDEEEAPFRVMYGLRDLDDESSAAAFLDALGAGKLCVVKVLFRLLGGKGGFGALLKKQMSRGKKTTNVDACRDLSGRRLRHSKAVERIKDWMEKKKRDDELVAALTAEGPELPAPTPASESLDPEYLRKLKHASADRPAAVRDGMRAVEAEAGAAEAPKRARLAPAGAGGASAASAATAKATIGPQDALGMLSGSSSPEYEEEDAPAEAPGGGSSSAAAAPSSSSRGEPGGAAAGAAAASASASGSAGASSASEVKLRAPQSLARAFSKDPKPTAASAASAAAPAAAAACGAAAANPAPPVARGTSAAGAAAPLEDGPALGVAEVRKYSSHAELAGKVSADTLKRSLQALGLKCGGTPVQRAERLFLLKDTDLADLPRSVLAAPPKT